MKYLAFLQIIVSKVSIDSIYTLKTVSMWKYLTYFSFSAHFGLVFTIILLKTKYFLCKCKIGKLYNIRKPKKETEIKNGWYLSSRVKFWVKPMFSARFGHFWSGKYTLHIFRSKNKKKKKKFESMKSVCQII